MRMVGHVKDVEDLRKIYLSLVGKPNMKSLSRHGCKFEDNIKLICLSVWMRFDWLRKRTSKLGDETGIHKKGREFCSQLNDF